jgi:hypothetical protein
MGKPASKIGIPGRLRDNESRPCRVKGCSRNRLHFNQYCRLHQNRKYALGAADSRPIKRAEYRDAWIIVEKFVRAHQAHPRIIEGIADLEKWMTDAQLGRPVPGQKTVALLADKGAVAHPGMVLNEILAVALHSSIFDNPATRAPWLLATAMTKGIKRMPRLPNAMSRKVLGAAPLSCYYSAPDKKAMQREITRLLGDTIREMLIYFSKMEQIRNEQIAAKEKETPRPFIASCDRCRRNERVKAERAALSEAQRVLRKRKDREHYYLVRRERDSKKREELGLPPIKPRKLRTQEELIALWTPKPKQKFENRKRNKGKFIKMEATEDGKTIETPVEES